MIRRDYQFLVNCAESNDRSYETLKLTISSKNFNPLTSNPFDTTAISNIEFLIINKLQSHHRQIKKKKKKLKNILNFTLLQPSSIRCSTSAVTSNGNRFECQIISIRVLDSWQGRQEERREYGVGGAYRRSDRVKVCSVARYAHKSGYI